MMTAVWRGGRVLGIERTQQAIAPPDGLRDHGRARLERLAGHAGRVLAPQVVRARVKQQDALHRGRRPGGGRRFAPAGGGRARELGGLPGSTGKLEQDGQRQRALAAEHEFPRSSVDDPADEPPRG
jgi:hypothetical protein